MTLMRNPTTALQFGFLALLAISTAQTAWWSPISAAWRETIGTAWRRSMKPTPWRSPRLSRRRRPNCRSYCPISRSTPTRAPPRFGRRLCRPLADDADSRINRYTWEGGFFLLVLLGGMTVLTRTIRHDAQLRKRQQNFLAAVSHELKSPLASIRLAAESLIRRSDHAHTQRLGQRMLEDGERLLRMVENLLDTTRLEEGRIELKRDTLGLAGVVEASVAHQREAAREHGVDIEVNVAGELQVDADAFAIETVLRNLLDNAVKACVSGQGRNVWVGAEPAGRFVRITVRDDGSGFSPKDAAMIFEKFYRLGDEMRRSTQGTGLGLYLVRGLAELSGARVSAASDGPGQGATITVEWPAPGTKP